MLRIRDGSRGFTLVELLIVVIVLGILAAAVIPQFSGSTDEARLSTLDTDLSQLRGAIELYYHQHSSIYPGANREIDAAPVATAAEAKSAFVSQLTLYSSATGVTSTTKDATYKYGPYIRRALPVNPFNDNSDVLCDIATTDITSLTTDGSTGWKFYVNTGILVANDGSHDNR
jgi:general secretion pathway protein G